MNKTDPKIETSVEILDQEQTPERSEGKMTAEERAKEIKRAYLKSSIPWTDFIICHIKAAEAQAYEKGQKDCIAAQVMDCSKHVAQAGEQAIDHVIACFELIDGNTSMKGQTPKQFVLERLRSLKRAPSESCKHDVRWTCGPECPSQRLK